MACTSCCETYLHHLIDDLGNLAQVVGGPSGVPPEMHLQTDSQDHRHG